MTPKVSVIVPVYKAEAYLHRCVDSILAQTFQDFEVLLIDDGSPDGSGEICDEYAKKDNRVWVFHKENGGVSAARNFAIKQARGEWITFVDADDWIDKCCMELCLNAILIDDLDTIQFGYIKVFANLQKKYVFQSPLPHISNGYEYVKKGRFNVTVWGGFYNKNIINKYQINFPTELRLAEDQIFVFQYLKNAKRVKYFKLPLYYYYQNDNSAIHNKRSEDMLLASLSLINLKKDCPILAKYINTMVVSLLFCVILNRDRNVSEIVNVYNMLNPKMFAFSKTSCSIFDILMKISPKLAICLLCFSSRLKMCFSNIFYFSKQEKYII